MQNEFQSEGFIKDRLICYKHDVRAALVGVFKRLRGVSVPRSAIKSRISNRKAKELTIRHGIAIAGGQPSWFYFGFDRGNHDPLTNHALTFIEENVDHGGRILVTGCGTGITAFHLADCGFREVVGIDIVPEAIEVANEIKAHYNYDNTSFIVGDCFHPTLEGKFHVITAMHWLFSAWSGNYGNEPIELERAKDPAEREKLLNDLFAAYAPHLVKGGFLIAELTDAVTDYRLPADHQLGVQSQAIYPVRHSPEQVRRCAEANGLAIHDKQLCVSFGHHPRTSYTLIKL